MPTATSAGHARVPGTPRLSAALTVLLRSGLAVLLIASAARASTAAVPGGDIEAEGPIQALGASSVTVSGQTFAVTAQTDIHDGDDNPLTFGDLAVGLVVEVEGHTAPDGTLVADEIEVEDEDGPGDGDDDGEVEAEGLVTARTDSSLTVGGLTFGVTAATVIEADGPVTFDDIVVGLRVEVEGRLLAGNALVATKIKVDEEEGEEEGDIEVEGLITFLRGDSLGVAGRTFTLTPATVVVDDDDRPVPRDTLAVGQRVEVYGRYLADGSLTATRIELEDYDDGEIELTGVIEALAPSGLTVAGTAFAVTSETVVLDDDHLPIPFSALVLGQTVEVRGVSTGAGGLVATHIKTEDHGEYDEEVEVRAALDATGDSLAVVLGRPFVVLPSTQILGLGDEPVALADLPLGQPVEVDARRDADGRLVALRIRREDGSVTAVRLQAAVTAVAADSVEVLGVPFGAATAVVVRSDGTPATLADLAVGQDVLVTGVREAAGGFTATRVEIRRAAQAAGRVGQATANGFSLPGLQVGTTAATLFVSEAGAPVAASSVSAGAAVRAFGTTTGTGALAATRVVVLAPATLVAAEPGDAALGLAIERVFPNPTTRTATVRYTVRAASAVRLTVVDALGRTVLTLADGPAAAGTHEARLDAGALPAGLYVVRLSVDGRTAGARPVTVVR